MKNYYKNIVFTEHALERMSKRSISKDKIWQIINHPDKTLKKSKSKKYLREINGRKYQVVATYLANEKKYLVISTWVRGEDDKQSIVWILVSLPFKIIWWFIKKLFGK